MEFKKDYLLLTLNDYFYLASNLKNGEIFIYPTETIYGIGGNALIDEVHSKIVNIKGRDENKKFIWLFKDLNMIKKYLYVNVVEENLIKKYHPGPLTIILNAKIKGYDTIACRISPHPFIIKLFEFIDFPIISTSANLSKEKYSNDFNRIYRIFKRKIKIFIQDKRIENKESPLPSTIIKVEDGNIITLRQGILKI